MALTYGSMGQIGRVGFKEVYYMAAKRVPDIWRDIVGLDFTSNQQYEEWMQLAPFGNATIVPVGDSAPQDQPSVIVAGRFDPALIGKRWSYYKNLPVVDQYKKVRSLMPMVAAAHKHTINQLAANLNINGFSSGSGIAAEALYSTAHTLSGTGSNRPTVDLAFGPLAIQSMKQIIMAQNDAKGNPLNLGGRTAITVSILNDQYGKVVAKSGYLPGTPNNDVNVAMEETTVRTVRYYSPTSTAWFVRGDNAGLFRLTLTKFDINALPLQENYFYPFITDESLVFGWKHWQDTAGTTGA